MRQPPGIAIAGGLAPSQILTLYATPVICLWFQRPAALPARDQVAPRESAP
jgi:hypothetical protein